MTETITPDQYEFYEYFELDTVKDGSRYIRFGNYLYCAEDSIYDDRPELTWREVMERFSLPLERYIQMRDRGESPWSSDEADNRPSDYIEDVSEEEATRRFNEYLRDCPRLDGSDIRMDTPDGGYFGVI